MQALLPSLYGSGERSLPPNVVPLEVFHGLPGLLL
jgi:hypothetical protein